MVTQFGMSDRVGCVNYQEDPTQPDVTPIAETTATLIDEEIRRLIKDAEMTAHNILTEHRAVLDRIAQTLLERETLSGDEIRALLASHEAPLAPV